MTFGNYEQDNNFENGKEPILWIVLEFDESKALLLSLKSLDQKLYTPWDPGEGLLKWTTWDRCTLRSWLNSDFMSAAFNTAETTVIATTAITTPDNPYSGEDGGADTNDQVFLLSIGEAESYFTSNASRICLNSDYAKTFATAQGLYTDTDIGCWFLRTPGYYNTNVSFVSYDGIIVESGTGVALGLGAVRPAMWVILGS